MDWFGRLESRRDKGFADINLQGVGTKQVAAAHDVGDAHVEVVHGDGQLVGVDAVRTADDGVADVLGEVVMLVAEHFVVEGDGGVVGGDAQRMAVAFGEALFYVLRVVGDVVAACSRVYGETVAFLRCRCGADIGARAEARVYERCRAGGVYGVAGSGAVGIGIVGIDADSADFIADFVNTEVAEQIERFLI